jgi:hypothetical protein
MSLSKDSPEATRQGAIQLLPNNFSIVKRRFINDENQYP